MRMQNISWNKLPSGVYRVDKYTDDSMLTLALFLEDGLGIKAYIDFLENEELIKLIGNISMLRKKGEFVSILINEDIFPNMPYLEISISSLICILVEYKKLYLSQVDRIEITIDENDHVTITGEVIQ